MATIKQIAQMAGVSRGTVDRVLNNRGLVNPQTEARVREVARALHYTPSRAGQALATKKRKLRIAFLLFDTVDTNPFFIDVLEGIRQKSRELKDLGVSVQLLHSAFGNAAAQAALLQQVAQQGYDGVAVTPLNHPLVAAAIQKLTDQGLPVITVNTDIQDSSRLAYVGSDYYKGGRTAGNLMHLITGGRGQVGIVTGSAEVLCHTQRVDGFASYLAQHCPKLHQVETVQNNDDDFESFDVTRDLLQRHPEVDALFLAAAGVQGACRALQALDRRVQVICFDPVPQTRALMRSGLIAAAIGQQPEKQGSQPLEMLVESLSFGTPLEDYICSTQVWVAENLE